VVVTVGAGGTPLTFVTVVDIAVGVALQSRPFSM
jgi:hypothetical protein